MKRLFLFALLTAAVTVGQQPSFGQMAKVKELHKADLDTLFATPERVMVVDVRSPGAALAYVRERSPFTSALKCRRPTPRRRAFEKHLGELPKDREIIVSADTMARAGAAASVLASHGFKVAGAVSISTY